MNDVLKFYIDKKMMFLPSSKKLIIILVSSFTLLILFSFFGTMYEKELLQNFTLEELRGKSIRVAYILFYFISFSTMTLFIRHFFIKALKILNRQDLKSLNSKQRKVLDMSNKIIKESYMENVALVFNIILLLMFFIWMSEL